jgi:para-nitrobenzyl esterase
MATKSIFTRKTLIDRRQLVRAAGSFCLASSIFSPSLVRASGFNSFVVVETSNGRVRGVSASGVCSFKGIPYAGSVSGANRFKPAPPAKSWAGVRDALDLGPPSPQPKPFLFGPPAAEDCLVLNVWTPAVDGRRRPVMFYNHGGGFTNGSAGDPRQDGSSLAREYDVVVVESNHRLGMLGYLYLGDLLGKEYTGNQGMLDILAALKWTSVNIERFGGDPGNIMVWGESGGGEKTSCMFAMPEAAPLFHKASIESGPSLRLPSSEQAAATARAVLAQLGLSPANARKIHDVPLDKIIEAQVKFAASLAPARMYFGAPAQASGAVGALTPFRDGVHLPAHPFDPGAPSYNASKPLMVGTAHDEGVFLLLAEKEVFNLDEQSFHRRLKLLAGDNAGKLLATYRRTMPKAGWSELFLKIYRDGRMWVPSTLIAERKAAQHSAPVYMYTLSYPLKLKVPGTNYPMGTPHAFDIPTKFANPLTVSIASSWPGLYDNDVSFGRLRTSMNMSEMWATFARTGHPGAKSQPNWPTYSAQSRATMLINEECRVVIDPDREERLAWESLPQSA